MVLSEYWKPLEENFRKRLFPRFLKNDEIYKNIFSPAFSNILKEPILVQKQTLHQQKALDLSFNLAPWKWAWHHQEGVTPPRRKKHRSARRVFDFFPSMRALQPHDDATPTFRVPKKSWNQGLSGNVSFVNVLTMVLSEYGKRLEEIYLYNLTSTPCTGK